MVLIPIFLWFPLQFDEMVTDDMVVSQIDQNRGGYEENVRQLAAPVAAQLCAAIVTIEQIVVYASVNVTDF